MGEERQDAGQSRPVTRLTVSEAAAVLGISVEAVRGRIKRGTIEHTREGDRIYVLLGGDQSATGRDQGSSQPNDQSQPVGDQMPLVENLLDQVAYLREQLAEEREARRRADMILAQLARANEEQAHTIRELEAPREQPEAPQQGQETAQEPPKGPERVEDRETVLRPWWRRWFG